MTDELDELEKFLETEASAYERDEEVERVLKTFKLNPFELLALKYEATERDIKLAYRRKSLLVHPDKCKHPRAQEAFGLLAKAQEFILDEEKKRYILEIVEDAKDACRKKKRIKSTDPMALSPQFLEEVKGEIKRLLVEEELRRRKSVKRIMENEGKEAQEKAKVVQEAKDKRDGEKAWEETREVRVASWRDFQNKSSSKKKASGEFKPPKASTSDDAKTYVRRVNNAKTD